MAYFVFACAMILLLFASNQILTRDKQPLHYCMAAACFFLSWSLLYMWAVRTGLVRHLPLPLLYSDISAHFLGVTGFYLTSLTILRAGERPVRSYLAYFVVPALFAIGFGLYNTFGNAEYLGAVETLWGHVEHPGLARLAAVAYFGLVVAIALNLVTAYRLRKSVDPRRRRGIRTQVFFLCLYLGPALLSVVGGVFLHAPSLDVAVTAIAAIAAGFTLTCTSISYFSPGGGASEFRKIVAKQEWIQSAGEFDDRLRRLMDDSAPYLDAELTLPDLARMLGEEPKRLSFHLNVILSTNFRRFISDLRLEAVCRDLVANPASSILETAFADGFNSKSSFNTLFMEKYGMTPREFRSAHLDSAKNLRG